MEGIQKTVALGLRTMANRVEKGRYGYGDEAFKGEGEEDRNGLAFSEDLQDEVIDKME